MSTPFKVGERVAVYVYEHQYGEHHPGNSKRIVCEISAIKGDLVFCAHVENLNLSWFHSKQCRRLRPKKALREFWIDTDDWVAFDLKPGYSENIVHVREVRPGKAKKEQS